MAFPLNLTYIPVTSVASKWMESSSNWIYQIDISSLVSSDSTYKGKIASASNIAVYDTTGTKINRDVSWDGTNKCLVSFNSSKDNISDKIFRIYADPTINESDSTLVWNGSGAVHRYGFNEFTSSSTTLDSLGTKNGTKVRNAITGNSSYTAFGNACYIPDSTSYINTLDNTEINGAGRYTIEYVVKASSIGFGSAKKILYMKYKDTSNQISNYYGSDGRFYCSLSNASNMSYFSLGSDFTSNTFYHVASVFNGIEGTDNASKFKFYVNGSPKTLTFSGTIGNTICDATTKSLFIGNNVDSASGIYIDEHVQYAEAKSQNYLKDRYTQFFDSGAFTYGSTVNTALISSVSRSGNMSYTITGTGLGSMTPTVTVGGVPATVKTCSSTSCTITLGPTTPSGYNTLSFTSKDGQYTTYSLYVQQEGVQKLSLSIGLGIGL